MFKIEKLIAEARAIPDSEIVEPDLLSDDCDHVVGVLLDRDLRGLFHLKNIKIDALRRVAAKYSKEEQTRENKVLGELDRECDVLGTLFWSELRAAHPEIAAKEKIGVRKGWEVVWSDPDPLELALGALMRGAA